MLLVLITHSNPRIGHLYLNHFVFLLKMFQHDSHPSTFRSKLKRIGKQIHHNLAHLVSIESHGKMIHTRENEKCICFLSAISRNESQTP